MLNTHLKKFRVTFLIIIFLFTSVAFGYAQAPVKIDRKEKKPHSPHKATVYSFILPGLGQAYNKKYWKIPVWYAGFGFLVYMINSNKKEYKLYKAAYEFEPATEEELPPNDYYEQYSKEQLKEGRDYYRRNMELSYILSGFWYLINVIDAAVDAHLFEFKVSDNLSFKIEPQLYHQPVNNKAIPGLGLQIKIPGVFGFK